MNELMGTAEGSYQFGIDAAELERLDLQGRMLAPATQTILQVAGLDRGMRVLDLGCRSRRCVVRRR
jgi:hypothetical protein